MCENISIYSPFGFILSLDFILTIGQRSNTEWAYQLCALVCSVVSLLEFGVPLIGFTQGNSSKRRNKLEMISPAVLFFFNIAFHKDGIVSPRTNSLCVFFLAEHLG